MHGRKVWEFLNIPPSYLVHIPPRAGLMVPPPQICSLSSDWVANWAKKQQYGASFHTRLQQNWQLPHPDSLTSWPMRHSTLENSHHSVRKFKYPAESGLDKKAPKGMVHLELLPNSWATFEAILEPLAITLGVTFHPVRQNLTSWELDKQ